MDYENIIKKVISKLEKNKADDIVVSSAVSKSSQIKFSDNVINTTKDWENTALSIFASFNKRIVTTSLRDLSEKSIERGIKLMSSFAKKLPINEEYQGIAKGPFKYNKIDDLYDKKVAMLSDDAIDIVNKGINSALNNKAKRASGVFEFGNTETFLMTNNGVNVNEKGTSLYFSIRSFLEKDSSGHRVCNSTMLKDFDVEKAGKNSAEIALMAKSPVSGKAGKYDVLFSRLAFANILERVGDSASAFSVESGLSFLGDKIGKDVASPIVNLYDDGTLKGGVASRVCDDEGTPTQKTALIQNGKLNSYLHNYSTAVRFKTKSTGNAGLISPHSSNLVLSEGDYNDQEMIKSVKKGIYITNLWYTRFQNYQTGDFSTIPRDGIFIIENGEIKKSIKNIRISENVLNIMKNVSRIGKGNEQIMGWEVESPVFTPMVYVKDVNITVSK